jgi:hypothetical protein
VVAAAASPPAPIRNCLRLMAIVLPFAAMKALSQKGQARVVYLCISIPYWRRTKPS